MSVKSVMTALAAQVRRLTGRTGTLSLEAMTDALDGIVDNGTVTKTLDTSTTSYTIPAGKHSGSGKVSITTQEKSVTPSTSAQTVTPDSGKVLSKVSVAAVASATQATPSISVATGGMITASATQEEGYVAAGTKQAKHQLPVQGATVITPSDSIQTAVSAGTYCIGDIRVAAASSGKQVYSGTVTPTAGSNSVTISNLGTGVTAVSGDTFIMFADVNSASSGSAYAVISAIKTPSKTALCYAEAWYDESEGSSVTINNAGSATISFSGSSITVKSGGSYYRFDGSKFTWYLIKG